MSTQRRTCLLVRNRFELIPGDKWCIRSAGFDFENGYRYSGKTKGEVPHYDIEALYDMRDHVNEMIAEYEAFKQSLIRIYKLPKGTWIG